MKVLFVVHGPRDPLTAVFRNVSRRAHCLKKRGESADILTPNDFPRLKFVPGRLWPLVYPFFVAHWLWQKRKDYDLVQFHSYAGWVFHLVARFTGGRPRTLTAFQGLEPIFYRNITAQAARSGKRLSWQFRLFYGVIMPLILRASCRRSNRVICLNRAEISYLEEGRWASDEQIVLSENSVSRDFFIERQWRSAAYRLMFLGQWLDMKGISFLVEAFTRLARGNPDVELWCVGTLLDAAAVLASFPTDVQSQVTVRSRINRNELIDCLRQTDVFVLPSLSEGFNNALLEAMATGLPIVTTPVGAAPDILKEDESVLFVREADANALFDSVNRLLPDVGLRERLGRAAQNCARQYEEEKAFVRFHRLLREIMGNHSRGSEGSY